MTIVVSHLGSLSELLSAASLLSCLRTAYPEAKIRLFCRADLLAHARRLIPVRLDEIVAAESAQAPPCDLFIAADGCATPLSSAAQRAIEAPLTQDGISAFERSRSLLLALGVDAQTLPDDEKQQTALWQARAQSAEAQLAQVHTICEERLQLIHEQNSEIIALRGAADEPLQKILHGQAEVESFKAQLAQLHGICEERDALIREQAREISILRAAADERLQALRKVQEESERRGVMLTDMTMLAQEQEHELMRLRGERLSAK
jgi:hypothetical protein